MIRLPLQSLQGHVLKGFGRNHAVYLMLRLGEDAVTVRRRLSPVLSGVVTSAARQASASDGPSAGAAIFGLSWTGYRRLGVEKAAPDNEESGANLFRTGIRAGYWSPGTESWDENYRRSDIDAFLFIADDVQDRLCETLRQVAESLRPVATIVGEEPAYRLLRDPHRPAEEYEHFGFRDGIAQPADPGAVFTPEPTLANTEPSYGCLAVWMKFEQHANRLRQASSALAALSVEHNVDVTPEQIEEMCVGRRRDGEPLAPRGEGLNDFTFQNVPADACPFQAHVRAMNPRDGEPTKLIVRRGMCYGTEKSGGLLFLSFHRSLVDFLFLVQRSIRWRDPVLSNSTHWTEDDTSPVRGFYAGAPAQTWNLGGKQLSFPIADLVTLRGGEYFYIPSLNFIRELGEI
jgi:Dyp-type peroxidase family